jgi:hypothetical protein
MKKARIDSHIIFILFFPVVFLFASCLFLGIANAADVTLAWDANTETNLAGYKLYYDGDSDTEMYQGAGANEGDSPIVIYLDDMADTDSPTFTVTGLEKGQYYYFALTAFDTDGLESDFSDEVGVMTAEEAEEDDANSLAKSAADDAESDGGSDGGGGGGCFISGPMNSNHFSSSILLLAFASMVGIGCWRRD